MTTVTWLLAASLCFQDTPSSHTARVSCVMTDRNTPVLASATHPTQYLLPFALFWRQPWIVVVTATTVRVLILSQLLQGLGVGGGVILTLQKCNKTWKHSSVSCRPEVVIVQAVCSYSACEGVYSCVHVKFRTLRYKIIILCYVGRQLWLSA